MGQYLLGACHFPVAVCVLVQATGCLSVQEVCPSLPLEREAEDPGSNSGSQASPSLPADLITTVRSGIPDCLLMIQLLG